MSELIVESAVHGIAPRSDQLLRLAGDVERGRATPENYTELRGHETTDWLRLQQFAGINLQEDGKLGWQDHLRPIVQGAKGFAPDVDDAPVTRWFETNTFYRRPTIQDRLSFYDESLAAQWGDHLSLISPATFAALCNDDYPELPAVRNVHNLYADILSQAEHVGVSRVTLVDYLPPGSPEQQDALDRVEQLAEWHPDLQLSLISARPDVQNPVFTEVQNLGLGIGLSALRRIAATPAAYRPEFRDAEVWHTVIDAANTTRDRFAFSAGDADVLRELGVSRLVLTHNVDFERLPLPYAQEKVKWLGEFAAQARERSIQ